MSIERDSQIVFDPDGTLRATTSWISKHDEGLSELLKNVGYAYRPNRSNVAIEHHVAAILLVDAEGPAPARIGVLDVGGATLDDLDVNATHVVHSRGSGNNGGCDTNPPFLEDPPNETSS